MNNTPSIHIRQVFKNIGSYGTTPRVISTRNKGFSKKKRKTLSVRRWNTLLPTPHGELLSTRLSTLPSDLKPAERVLLNALVELDNRYHVIHVSQYTLADYCGLSRQYTNECLASLEQKGLIAMNYRHMNSNITKVTRLFHVQEIRDSLKGYLPALAKMTIAILMPFMFSVSNFHRFNQHEATQLYKEKYFIYNQSSVTSHPLQKKDVMSSRVIKNFQDFSIEEQQQFSVYPKEAINHANFKLSTSQKEHPSPVAWFHAVCKNYCRDKGISFGGSPSIERHDDVYKKGGERKTTTGKVDYLPPYMKPYAPSQEVKVDRNPVEEYYRVELLRETPKYKRAIATLKYHPENPFTPHMKSLGLPLTCDPAILEKMRIGEMLSHMSGAAQCMYNTKKVDKDGKEMPCAFAELYCPAKKEENASNLTKEGQMNVI